MSKLNPFAAAIGAAVVSTTFSISTLAANPFEITDLQSGYQLADSHKKEGEGKCGEGKCGEGMCGAEHHKENGSKHGEGKCGEGKCGEGMCGAKDDKDGKKEGEGKCGEGKCGDMKKEG